VGIYGYFESGSLDEVRTKHEENNDGMTKDSCVLCGDIGPTGNYFTGIQWQTQWIIPAVEFQLVNDKSLQKCG